MSMSVDGIEELMGARDTGLSDVANELASEFSVLDRVAKGDGSDGGDIAKNVAKTIMHQPDAETVKKKDLDQHQKTRDTVKATEQKDERRATEQTRQATAETMKKKDLDQHQKTRDTVKATEQKDERRATEQTRQATAEELKKKELIIDRVREESPEDDSIQTEASEKKGVVGFFMSLARGVFGGGKTNKQSIVQLKSELQALRRYETQLNEMISQLSAQVLSDSVQAVNLSAVSSDVSVELNAGDVEYDDSVESIPDKKDDEHGRFSSPLVSSDLDDEQLPLTDSIETQLQPSEESQPVPQVQSTAPVGQPEQSTSSPDESRATTAQAAPPVVQAKTAPPVAQPQPSEQAPPVVQAKTAPPVAQPQPSEQAPPVVQAQAAPPVAQPEQAQPSPAELRRIQSESRASATPKTATNFQRPTERQSSENVARENELIDTLKTVRHQITDKENKIKVLQNKEIELRS